MELNRIQSAASLLEVLVVAVLIWCRPAVTPLLPGAIFLIVATYPGLFSIQLATNLRIRQRRGSPEPAAWLIHTRAYVLLLAGWQVVIVGLLNLWPFAFPDSRVSGAIGYVLMIFFLILSYKLVAIADTSKQEGGARPISYFGRPRSRRLFLCGLVYTPIIPLIILSSVWSGAQWCPVLLRRPQVWLLVVTLLSTVSSGLIFQRYRGAREDMSKAQAVLIIVTIVVLGLAATVQMILHHDVYVYALSSITLIFIAVTIYWLLFARSSGESVANGTA